MWDCIYLVKVMSSACIINIPSHTIIPGNITISGGVELNIVSEIHGPSPQFTLTCNSTGGPATTVTWTRDSVTVTEGTETVLDDPETAEYIHTLTVTGLLPGLYTCTVENNKPSNDSANITVQGIELHFNLLLDVYPLLLQLSQLPVV